ncbi:DUF929 domain-containing protein [Acidianus brierleyi]|uniref:DUF929 domain-containing protein n=1 Tax=Acidianus brierleyi TaxID=41673 RepID=A0A2U9IHU0_9CREN|nr:DUF929 domain-containing protein [Acidianus brierleyi]AWR95580.1 DUF929 domain-containing protein [Acidianus brierleyi]
MMKKTIIAIIALIVIIAGISYYELVPKTSSQSVSETVPFGKFIKVSNVDYAPPGKVEIFEQSWIGCPVGATASWVIYMIISHYGKVSYYTHYSDPYDKVAANIPGIIFTGFTPNSSLEFNVVYTYNEYLNATPTGTPVSVQNLISVGKKELEESLPQNISKLFIEYETQVPVEGYHNASAYIVSPPHLNFGLIITGPNGTYVLTTPLVNPNVLKGDSITYVMQNMYNITTLVNAASYLQEIINEAYGSSAPIVNCIT